MVFRYSTGTVLEVPQRPYTTVQISRLITIPLEVREIIYYHFFQGSTITYETYIREFIECTRLTRTYRHFGLLMTCRQIAQEAFKIYQRVSLYRLGAGFSANCILRTLHPTVRQTIQFLEITYLTATSLASLLDHHFSNLNFVQISGSQDILWIHGTKEKLEQMKEESIAEKLQEILRNPPYQGQYVNQCGLDGVFALLAKRPGLRISRNFFLTVTVTIDERPIHHKAEFQCDETFFKVLHGDDNGRDKKMA